MSAVDTGADTGAARRWRWAVFALGVAGVLLFPVEMWLSACEPAQDPACAQYRTHRAEAPLPWRYAGLGLMVAGLWLPRRRWAVPVRIACAAALACCLAVRVALLAS